MKAQLNIEFILSVSIFMIIVSYAIFNIFNILPFYHQESGKIKSTIKAEIVADMLIFDEGWPVNWNAGNVERIGLSNGNDYYLVNNKIVQLGLLCVNYNDVRNKMNADVVIKITNMKTDLVVLDCRPSVSNYRYERKITRFGIVNNDIMKVEVSVLI